MSSKVGALARMAVAGVLALSTMVVAGASVSASAAAATRPAQDAAHPYRHGIVFTREHSRGRSTTAATSANDLNFGGGVSGVGVTTGPPQVYLVFWGSQWGSQSTNAQGYQAFSSDPNSVA